MNGKVHSKAIKFSRKARDYIISTSNGGITVSRFLEAGVVDDITVSIIAMVLGSGIPLFSAMNQEHKCRLVSTQSYPSGLVQLKYEVIRDS